MLAGSRLYTLVLLGRGPDYGTPESQPVIWEHGRRNFQLRASGALALVGPLTDGGAFVGMVRIHRRTRRNMHTDGGGSGHRGGNPDLRNPHLEVVSGDGLPALSGPRGSVQQRSLAIDEALREEGLKCPEELEVKATVCCRGTGPLWWHCSWGAGADRFRVPRSVYRWRSAPTRCSPLISALRSTICRA